MKKLALLIVFGLAAVAIVGMSCGGPDEPVEEIPVDTTTVAPEDTATPPPPPPPPPPPKKLKEEQLQTVYFDFDKFELRSDAKRMLDGNYELLKEFPDVIVQIEGHCDERGTVEYNLSLGEQRAKACQTYLISLGIAPERLTTISYGEERPVDPGHNEEAWAKNRRAEFRIVSQ